MTEPRVFPLADVLSVTTPRLLSDRGVDGLTDLLNFMTGDILEIWQLLRAADEARPALVAQHPFLVDLQPPAECDKAALRQWLADAVADHGAALAVTALSGWVHQDPAQEFVDRVELARLGTLKPQSLADRMRAAAESMEGVGAAFRKATGSVDGLTMAERPDLDALNHELNNTYPDAFGDPA